MNCLMPLSKNKNLSSADRKQLYREWESGSPDRNMRYQKLVRYAGKIKEISNRYKGE